MKTCTKCGVEKALDEFYKQKDGGQGRRGDCKLCFLKGRKEHRDAHPEKMQAWRDANRDHIAAYNKKRQRDGYFAAYYQANKESWKAAQDRYRSKPEVAEKIRRQRRMRWALKAGGVCSPGGLDPLGSDICYWCGEAAEIMEEDHVIPLKRGGSDEPGNRVWACRTCNRRKHAKHPLRWIAEQFEEAV